MILNIPRIRINSTLILITMILDMFRIRIRTTLTLITMPRCQNL